MEEKIYPLLEDFIKFADGYDYVPVCREIVADLDRPLTLNHKLAAQEEFSFLLESLEGDVKIITNDIFISYAYSSIHI